LANDCANGKHRLVFSIGRKCRNNKGKAAQCQAEDIRPPSAKSSVKQIPEEQQRRYVDHGENEEVVQLRVGLEVDGVVGDAAVADQTGDEDKRDDEGLLAEALSEEELGEVVLVIGITSGFLLERLNVAHQRQRHWAAIDIGYSLQLFVCFGVFLFRDEPKRRLWQPSEISKYLQF